MKKTITISISNRTFQIEDDAYLLLDKYIKNLESYFQRSDPDGEIVSDIEDHISELFEERSRLGVNVITIDEVKAVIDRVGSVDDIAREEGAEPVDETADETKTEEKKESSREPLKDVNFKKKYYRHPTDRWLGGVLGGVGSYLNLDSLVVRLLFIALLLTPLAFILLVLYLAVWFFFPKATSIGEILEMEGEEVTANSIWQKINAQEERRRQNEQRKNRPGGLTNLSESPDGRYIDREVKPAGMSWLVWGAIIVVALIVIGGIMSWFAFMSDYTGIAGGLLGSLKGVLGTISATLAGMGFVGVVFIIPILIVISIFVLLFFTIAVVPVGIILKNPNWKIGVKVVLTVLWFVFLYWIIR